MMNGNDGNPQKRVLRRTNAKLNNRAELEHANFGCCAPVIPSSFLGPTRMPNPWLPPLPLSFHLKVQLHILVCESGSHGRGMGGRLLVLGGRGWGANNLLVVTCWHNIDASTTPLGSAAAFKCSFSSLRVERSTISMYIHVLICLQEHPVHFYHSKCFATVYGQRLLQVHWQRGGGATWCNCCIVHLRAECSSICHAAPHPTLFTDVDWGGVS